MRNKNVGSCLLFSMQRQFIYEIHVYPPIIPPEEDCGVCHWQTPIEKLQNPLQTEKVAVEYCVSKGSKNFFF